MNRSRKTSKWYKAHINDEFVKLANKGNWRCRAVFKLKEIDEKYNLINADANILDLGSAPGGWSQYATQKHSNLKITAVDLLDMESIETLESEVDNIAPKIVGILPLSGACDTGYLRNQMADYCISYMDT